MNTIAIPEATEKLLLYLLVTNLRGARTLGALRKLGSGDLNIDKLLTELIDGGYVYEDEDTFELTFSGLHTARQVQTHAQSQRLGLLSDARCMSSQQTETLIPTFDTHPLRAGAEVVQKSAVGKQQKLQYMLAFENPKNVLPIPVMDGDILGRVPDVDIAMPHDEYVSGEHCRFSVETENGQTILYIEDLGSRNGTSINEFQLEQGQLFGLEHGDRVYIGSTVLIVVKIPS